ncbi:MAG: hypothetical protein QXT84_06065 [Candidatus Bathyarchaeia archaeon]
MPADWITPEMVQASVVRNNIYLTKEDALKILDRIDQQGAYEKHSGRVKVEIWRGQNINGVDVTNHPGGKVTLDRGDPQTIILRFFMDEVNKRLKALGQPEIRLPDMYVPTAPRYTSHRFITNDTGLAYLTYVDGKLIGFQPHVPGIQGYHALTSKTIKCHRGHIHDKCPTCGGEHDIEQVIEVQKDTIIKNLASSELMTKVLYIAQEIYDRRLETIDKFPTP